MAASSAPRSRGRAERAAGAIAIGLIALGLVVTVARLRDGDPLDRARDLVADDGNFATAIESGVTFTKVSTALEDAADDCEPATEARCENLYAAAGFARVSAVGVLRCTRPGVFDARQAMRTLLDDLDDAATARIPAVVSCR
jgi:hypothetical protein